MQVSELIERLKKYPAGLEIRLNVGDRGGDLNAVIDSEAEDDGFLILHAFLDSDDQR